MPCRRPHRKSRLGCKNCKAKRTKCDEVHPVCGNCKKYAFHCDFNAPSSNIIPSLPPMKISALKKPTSLHPAPLLKESFKTTQTGSLVLNHATQTEVSLGAMTINTPQDRLLELNLMHHFTTMLSKSLFRLFGNSKSQRQAPAQHLFPRWVTDLAMSNHGLMDALLGFSAFNLRKLKGGGDKNLTVASHVYMTAAIKAHSEHLRRGISAETAEILFAGGSLIALVSISSREYLSPEDDTSIPLHWFQPWQGLRSIVRASLDHMHSKDALALLEAEKRALLADFALPYRHPRWYGFLLDDLDRSVTDTEALEAYESSVFWLSLIEDNPDQDYCFKFTAKVVPKFVEMLKQHDPRTLTIVGYYFMVLHQQNEQVWWLPRTTGREFRNLMQLLPDEWKPRMAIAAEAFGAFDE